MHVASDGAGLRAPLRATETASRRSPKCCASGRSGLGKAAGHATSSVSAKRPSLAQFARVRRARGDAFWSGNDRFVLDKVGSTSRCRNSSRGSCCATTPTARDKSRPSWSYFSPSSPDDLAPVEEWLSSRCRQARASGSPSRDAARSATSSTLAEENARSHDSCGFKVRLTPRTRSGSTPHSCSCESALRFARAAAADRGRTTSPRCTGRNSRRLDGGVRERSAAQGRTTASSPSARSQGQDDFAMMQRGGRAAASAARRRAGSVAPSEPLPRRGPRRLRRELRRAART